MQYLLYILLFVFGFYTHKTFQTYRSAQASIALLFSAQITSILILLKAIENYSYVKTFGANQLRSKEATDNEVKNYELYIDNDIKYFKNNSVKQILRQLPEHFRLTGQFDDWESAMQYLETTKTHHRKLKND